MQDQIDLVRSTLEATGTPIVDVTVDEIGDLVVTTRADGFDRSIQIPSAIGALGYEMIDANVDSVSRHVARRLPELSSSTVGAFAAVARRAAARGDWLVIDPIVPVLLDEIGDPPRLADPMRDRMRAVRHVVRISRMAADAVSSGLLDVPDDDAALLTDPVAYELGRRTLPMAA